MFDVSGPDIARLGAFTAVRKVTVVAQQDPPSGRRVFNSVAARFRADLTQEDVPLFDDGAEISQLAVASDVNADWCAAVDHRGDSAGYLCMGQCGQRDCPRACDGCGQARWPALAVRRCDADDCEKLLAYVDTTQPAIVSRWVSAQGAEHELPLTAALDAGCAPVVLRAQRADQTQFVIAAAHSGAATPWLGLVAPRGDSQPSVAAELVPEPSEGAQLLELAGAADDSGGQLLFSWVWSDANVSERKLVVARTAWQRADELLPLRPVFERVLSSEGSVSVAFAHYGLAGGGFVVAFRDGARAFALRVDLGSEAAAEEEGALRASELTGADVSDFVVAPHPAGSEASSPFVYIDRVDKQARVHACK